MTSVIYQEKSKLNNGTNTSNLMSSNVSKLRCVLHFKGVIGCKIHFTSCLNINVCWKCRHPSFNDKNSRVFFLNHAVLRVLSEWCSSVQATPPIIDWQARLTFDPPWVSWVNCLRCRGRQEFLRLSVFLSDFVVGCNNEYSSRQLLLTSEPLKTQRINVAFVIFLNNITPGWWNDLPTPIRNAGSLSISKKQLKTHLFRHYLTLS